MNLKQWINSIWGPFCDCWNPVAKSRDIGFKFLHDGSWATIIAIWIDEIENHRIKWMSYGDSALFVFDLNTEKMNFCSVSDINQFTQDPYLINWIDTPIYSQAFGSGELLINSNQLVILASDAIAQLILLKYMLWEKDKKNVIQLDRLEKSQTRLANQMLKIKAADSQHFFCDFIPALQKSLNSPESFRTFTNEYLNDGMITKDDYSLIMIHL